MRLLLILLLLLSSVGCCATEKAFRLAHEKFTRKLTNWIPADNEASKYKDKEEASRAYLQELRRAPTVYHVSTKIRADGFHWHKEAVDFVSYPWVTIARKRGDCDDFMALWAAALKYAGKTERVTVSSTGGGAHAMLLYVPTGSEMMYILSNTVVLGSSPVADWRKLVKLFYREKTKCYLKY